jgi:glutamate N-acetyltransferase/amino-acid N-acetyltransferase
VSAIIVNAGNANCATKNGDEVALVCCRAVAKQLKVPVAQILPASTGVIGVEMDPVLVTNALPRLFEDLLESRFPDVAHAMMTTDTVPKMAHAEVALKGGEVQIAGHDEGVGHDSSEHGYDTWVRYDGCRYFADPSSSDAGEHGGTNLQPAECRRRYVHQRHRCAAREWRVWHSPSERERRSMEESLCLVMEDLAEQIARDGEGASKLITIRVVGAQDEESGRQDCTQHREFPLVKTAVAGSDPNWGRVLSAAGTAGVEFDPNKVDIFMQGVPVCAAGVAADFSEAELKTRLDDRDILIRFEIRGDGRGETRFWTCDFTEGLRQNQRELSDVTRRRLLWAGAGAAAFRP